MGAYPDNGPMTTNGWPLSLGVVRTRADVLADLERRLLAGEFGVGSKLPSERILGDQYGVSRPVVREALSGLVERGFIEIFPGRGSYVRASSADALARPLATVARRQGVTARDLVVARLMLETTAAELAAEHADHVAVQRLRQTLAAHEAAASLGEQVSTDLAFHEAIAGAGGNPIVVVMFGSIRHFVHTTMVRSHRDPEVRAAGDPLHTVICDRIAAHDPPGASSAMREHLALALDLYGPDLDVPLGDLLDGSVSEGRAPYA